MIDPTSPPARRPPRRRSTVASLGLVAVLSFTAPSVHGTDPGELRNGLRCEGSVAYVLGQPLAPVSEPGERGSIDLYVPMHLPSDRSHWPGNLKKYRLCTDPSGCPVGAWLDADGQRAKDPDTGALRDTARSLWSSHADGADVLSGGAASRIPPPEERRAYSDRGGVRYGPGNAVPAPPHRLDPAAVAAPEQPGGWPDADTLGLPPDSDPESVAELVDWMRGRADGTEAGSRHAFAAPVSSRPALIPYGFDPGGNPIAKLLIGTGAGALHMIDADSGEEEWIFHLPGLLPHQAALRANEPGPRIPGADASPRVLVIHAGGDGVLDPDPVGDHPGDRVIAYTGLGRGGRAVYALDITPASVLTSRGAGAAITPRLLWWIEGSDDANTDIDADTDTNANTNANAASPYRRLGQTSSPPTPVRIRMTDATGEPGIANVLVFGGGHDPAFDHGSDPFEDADGHPPARGAAIYLVDALTGAPVLIIGAAGDSPPTAIDLEAPAMVYPIPAEVATLDTNGDGTVDRLYAADLGGQVWRIDLDPALSHGSPGNTAAARLAVLADPADPAQRRRFLHPPIVTHVPARDSDSGHAHDLVLLASGDPDDRGEIATQDRVYALRDYHLHAPLDHADPERAYPLCVGGDRELSPCGEPLGDADLRPRYEPESASSPATVAPGAESPADRRPAHGWRISLSGPGERSVANPELIDGRLYVTTWERVDGKPIDPCADGHGRLYEIDLNDTPDEPEEASPGTPPDPDPAPPRTPPHRDLGPGFPAPPLLIVGPDGIRILTPTGPEAGDDDGPSARAPIERTYWIEELEWDD